MRLRPRRGARGGGRRSSIRQPQTGCVHLRRPRVVAAQHRRVPDRTPQSRATIGTRLHAASHQILGAQIAPDRGQSNRRRPTRRSLPNQHAHQAPRGRLRTRPPATHGPDRACPATSRRQPQPSPDKQQAWTARAVEAKATDPRIFLSRENDVPGLTRKDVGEPIDNRLNQNLIVELLPTRRRSLSALLRSGPALRFVPFLVRAPAASGVLLVLPPVVLYAHARFYLTAASAPAGCLWCWRSKSTAPPAGQAQGRKGHVVLRVVGWVVRPGWPSPSPGPGGNQTSAGSAPGGGVRCIRVVLFSPVALPAEARSGFACQARGTTNLSRDVRAALNSSPPDAPACGARNTAKTNSSPPFPHPPDTARRDAHATTT